MDKLEELLPGIEEFLTDTLGQENLSLAAEERRQFFLERLDIIKLPPSLPPREGRILSAELLKETEQTSGVPSLLSSPGVGAVVCPDFAAAQRQISRSQAGQDGSASGSAGSSETPDGDVTLGSRGMKVYDDIDLPESPETHPSPPFSNGNNTNLDSNASTEDTLNDTKSCDEVNSTGADNDDNLHLYESGQDDDEENDHYEIPVARQQLPSITDDSVGEPPSPSRTLDGSMSISSKPGSVEELFESGSADGVIDPPLSIPPPLPPRRDVNVRWSDSELKGQFGGSFEGSGGSGGGKWSGSGSGDVPPELPFRPPQLPRRGEIVLSTGALRSDKSEHSERSDDRSDGDVSNGGSTSYESFDEDNDPLDSKMTSKLNIKLPAKPQKKSSLGSMKTSVPGASKKSQRPLNKSRLSSQWEVTAPFKQLENIDISGELYHRGKLSWNKRVVAITGGSLVMYKPEKEGARPSLVLQLSGYSAMVGDREGRRGYELRLTHPCDDSHTFAVDFRDWAHLWAEHINGTAKGQPPPKYHTHLARTFSGGETSTAHPTCSNKEQLNADLAGYGASRSNEIEAFFNSVDSDRDVGITNRYTETKRKGPFLTNTAYLGMTMGLKKYHANSSPKLLLRSKTLDASASQKAQSKTGDFSGFSREGSCKSIGAAMKEILVRRQRGLFKVTQDAHDSGTGISSVGTYNRKLSGIDAAECQSSSSAVSRGSFRLMPSSDRAKGVSHHQGRRPLHDKFASTTGDPCKPIHKKNDDSSCPTDDRYECIASHPIKDIHATAPIVLNDESFTSRLDSDRPEAISESASGDFLPREENYDLESNRPPLPLPVVKWDWRSLLLAWSLPLDQLITALRVSDISASNSNLSTGSEETGDEASKPKFRGDKVIRMGSFAYKATQFFETIGKKTTLKRKSSHPIGKAKGASGSAKSEARRQHQLLSKTSSSSFGDLRNGIAEESSQVSPSGSIGLGMSAVSPTSDCSLPPSFSSPVSNSDACSIGDRSTSLSGSGTPSQDSPLAFWGPNCRQRTKSGGGGSMGGDSLDLEVEEENGDTDPFLGVSHKGYLYVFSSFNKRRWGRRYCVIRTNWFECYHQRRSKSATQRRHLCQGEECWDTCELSFLLRPCVLRRAVKETGSELGLMLVENGKERITVEALSIEEMGGWVRAILAETTDQAVPEGLGEFLKEQLESTEADNGAVLQQWGLGAFVSGSANDFDARRDSERFLFDGKGSSKIQENKDCDAESFVKDSFNGNSTIMTSSCCLANDSEREDITLVPEYSENGAAKVDVVQGVPWNDQSVSLPGVLANVCRTSPGTKNTDSGCYSGRGANSDSDSGCENSSGGREAVDLDGGYATLDSSSSVLKQAAKQLQLGQNSAVAKESSKTESSNPKGEQKVPSLGESGSGNIASDSCNVAVVNKTSLLASPNVPVSSPSTLSPEALLDQSCPVLSNVPCKHSTADGGEVSHLVNPSNITSSPSFTTSSMPQSKVPCSSDIPTIKAPGGEEYSLVVKRSDKNALELESSQRSCRSSGDSSVATLIQEACDSTSRNHSCGSLTESEPIESITDSIGSRHVSGMPADSENICDQEHHAVFQSTKLVGSNSTKVNICSEKGDSEELSAEMEHKLSLSCNNNTEPLYEPENQCVGNISHTTRINLKGKELCEDNQALSDHISTSQYSLEKDINSTNSATNTCICENSIKDISHLTHKISEQGNCAKHSSECHQTKETFVESLNRNDISNICEYNLMGDIAQKDSIKDCGEDESCSKDTPLRISIPLMDAAGSLHAITNLTAISPSADWISSLLDKPETTSQDLQQAMQRLKDKQAEIRRKRMAVHDKRQRASSDGERLACEKEMAALEKLGESTESHFREIQNKLALLQGDSLDVLCIAANQPQTQDQPEGQGQFKAQGEGQQSAEGHGQGKRNKSGSRKRKQKRKS